jgi:pyruvate,water dikinase
VLSEVLSPLTRTALGSPRGSGAAVALQRPALSRLSSRQLLDRAAGIIGRGVVPLVQDHGNITAAAREAATGVRSACAASGDPAQALLLLGPRGDVDSAGPAEALWRLGRLVAESRTLTGAFDQGTDELSARLAGVGPDGRAFLAQFDAFLAQYGAHGPNDWDLMSPTWETHPGLPLAAIDRLRLVDDDDAPAARQARLGADRREGLARAGVALWAAIDTACRLLSARSRSKTAIVHLLHEARMPFYEIGRRMVEQGYLDRVADYGMVTLDEFPAFLDDPEDFGRTIRDRRAEYEAALPGAAGPDLRCPDGFTGVGASGGRATGAVRILSNPADPGHLQPGDIVVAPAADASWVPLFVPAGAVVVAGGDWLCHAAVACRELGIPAVFSSGSADTRLAEGSIVTVDGTAGTVTIRARTPVAGGRPGGS